MCRFLNSDGIYDTNTGVLEHNMFAYCNNDPINMIDSEGTGPLLNLIIGAYKKLKNIFNGTDGDHGPSVENISDSIKLVRESTKSYSDKCKEAKETYTTFIGNVVDSQSNKKVKPKPYKNKNIKLSTDSRYARNAYRGLCTHALNYGYDLHNMTWEDVKKHPQLEKELLEIYPIWDQASAKAIATVYGVDWFFEVGSKLVFR